MALYALGVGACGTDAVDEKELHFVYHRDGQPHIKVPLGQSPLVLVRIGGCDALIVAIILLLYTCIRFGEKFAYMI